ncbi:alpha/beta hydrolase-fold protein [Qipengyuania polymorpha]|nr:alpha/beta hydrolase-fold protein [Qipengyuania polymorpha]
MVPAPSLEGNLTGEALEQPVSVYLPPSYSEGGERRYPVVYLLHGFSGTNRTWLNSVDFPKRPPSADNFYRHAGILEKHRLDEIFSSGEVPEMILVAPSARNVYKHAFYTNSPITGNWEDHIAEDVVGFVDANYRTLARRESRALAGHSGGGHGTLFIASRNPELFSTLYAMAPCCLGPNMSLGSYFAEGSDEIAPMWQRIFTRIDAMDSIDDMPPHDGSKVEDFMLNIELGTGAAHSPDPSDPPFYGDRIYRKEAGRYVIDEEVLERRRANWNLYNVERHDEVLRSFEAIFIDYGEFEIPDLVKGNSAYVKALSERGIPFRMEVYEDGNHGNMLRPRMYSIGLQFLAENLDFGDEGGAP